MALLLLASIMSYLSRGWFVCIILLAERGGGRKRLCCLFAIIVAVGGLNSEGVIVHAIVLLQKILNCGEMNSF